MGVAPCQRLHLLRRHCKRKKQAYQEQKPRKEALLIPKCLDCTRRLGLIMAAIKIRYVQHWPLIHQSGQMAWMKRPFWASSLDSRSDFCRSVFVNAFRQKVFCIVFGCVDVMGLGKQTCMPGQVN